MNKFHVILLVIFLSRYDLKAQDFVQEKPVNEISFRNERYFEFGSGIATSIMSVANGPLQGKGSPAPPPLALFGEYRFYKQFALGLAFQYEPYRWRDIGQGSPAPSRIPIDQAVRFNAGMRLIFLPTAAFFSEETAKKHDVLMGLRFGQTWFSKDLPEYVKNDLYFLNRFLTRPRFTAQFFVGYVRYFNNNWGIFSEFALGSPYFFCAGLRYRK